MDEYKVDVSIEPTDSYNKARQDLFKAMQSIQKLSHQQKKRLAEELFGAESIRAAEQMFYYFSQMRHV